MLVSEDVVPYAQLQERRTQVSPVCSPRTREVIWEISGHRLTIQGLSACQKYTALQTIINTIKIELSKYFSNHIHTIVVHVMYFFVHTLKNKILVTDPLLRRTGDERKGYFGASERTK